MELQKLNCCGWQEISGLRYYQDLSTALKDLIRYRVVTQSHFGCGAVVFTQAGTRAKYGRMFAKDIQSAGLGTVVALPKFKNPNTGRIIFPFYWVMDRPAIIAYCQENLLFAHAIRYTY